MKFLKSVKIGLFMLAVCLGGGACLVKDSEPAQIALFAIYKALNFEKCEGCLGLSDYRAVMEAKPIEETSGLSSLTYNHDSQSLFSVSNDAGYIVELSMTGELIRKIKLDGFNDPEALEYLGDEMYLIADEVGQKIVLVNIGPETETVYADEAKASLAVGLELKLNKNFEGLAYDRESRAIYAAKELAPTRIYEIRGLIRENSGETLALSVKSDAESDKISFLKDLSALDYDPGTGHLLVLSHESKMLLELNARKIPVSGLQLLAGQHGLKASIPQAEGVATGPDGAIYIISEPNLFYIFKK